jgi:anti-sigma regulatory factor (Ser/Thr protein kinase)
MMLATVPVSPPGHAGPWPLISTLDLGALPSAVPCARHYATYVLAEWSHLARLTADAQLIVSELVSNAVCHALGPVTMRLRANSDSLLIEVQDELPAFPEPHSHAVDAECGRGLTIVSALSRAWGYYPERYGKTVWALVS